MNTCNTIVPNIIPDECKGCTTKSQCVLVEDNFPFLGITDNDRLRDLLLELVAKVQQQEARIQILEDNYGV